MTGARSTSRPRSATSSATRAQEKPLSTSPILAETSGGGPIRKNELIRASAGTGKTYQLSGQFIDRLRITEPERVLATTFTRAAAGEILERVLLRLAQAALDPQKLVELAGQIDGWHDIGLTQAECLTRLATLTRDLHRVRVGTLDSFFIQLAQSFSLELGLPPGWRILDDIEADLLVTQAIERLLTKDTQGDVGRLLNLIGKGDAGRNISGVLRRTVSQFYELYRQTDAAAWQKVPEPAPLSAEELAEAVNEFELAHVQVPENKHFQNAYNALRELLSLGDWEVVLSKGITSAVAKGTNTYYGKPIPPGLLAVCQPLVRHASAILIRQLASRTRVTWDLLDRFHQELVNLKDEQQGLTFSDVTRALGIGWHAGQLGRLDFRLDAAIEHLLLDEFQDTSIPQWQALEPLAQRVTTEPGASLFCVGDQKQAIYRWRGGVAELFDSIESRLPNIDSQPLARSYRSSPAVIDAVNFVCQRLHQHKDLGDDAAAIHRWQQRYDVHETAQTGLAGWVTLETYPEVTSKSRSTGSGSGDDGDDDGPPSNFDFAAARIAEVHRRIPLATIGVLANTNDSVAAMAQALRRLGVDASEEGGSVLTDCVGVQLILSLLQWLDHPGDTAARFHVATSPLGAALGLPVAGDEQALAELAADWRRHLLVRGYGPCVTDWAAALAPACDERGGNRLAQLVDLAYQYTPYATLRSRDFVEFVESQRVVQPSKARIRLLTIHKSKGLEFDIVFLPELQAKLVQSSPMYVTGHREEVEPADTVIRYANKQVVALLPPELQQVFRADRQRKIEERLCVLYVALTRARHALHMLVPPSTASERKLSLSMAHLLRASLTEGQRLPVGYRQTISGDENWWQRVPRFSSTPTAPVKPAGERSPLRIQLAPAAATVAGRQTVTPSQHGASSVRITDALSLERSLGRNRGTLVHAWFEQVQWLDDGPPDEAVLHRIARRVSAPGLDVDHCLKDFQAMLRSPDIAWTLSRQAYLSAEGLLAAVLASLSGESACTLRVQAERNFAVPLDNDIVRGAIDRLVLLDIDGTIAAADIVDYKTDQLDRLPPDEAARRLASYRTQLNLYRRAVAHMYDLPPDRVLARLAFVGARQVIPVE
ncbi:MAG: UvrD-helicase domain-containing protein [Planctomycetaceae bacterium]